MSTIICACAAKVKTGGRCRNAAQPGRLFCNGHGNGDERAVWPNRILLKANINERQAEKFLRLGVPEVQQDEQAKDQKHAAHAVAAGRDAHRYRKDAADSGVPVFGKDGAQNVSVEMSLCELLAVYTIVNIHIRARRDQNRWMRVLVVVFAKEGENVATEPVKNSLREFYGMSSWGFCHIWANPPQEDGTVVNTVNLSHKDEANEATLSLRLNDGLWAVESC
ncbi:MAG: hypothetical protein Q8Q48_00360 [Candidatus Staskawiczbacteria bacterium]|nr:hypothetical protein [Candidatus Staskawiczbacteria bacterium]